VKARVAVHPLPQGGEGADSRLCAVRMYKLQAAVSDRHRRSEIDATIYVALYSKRGPAVQGPRLFIRSCAIRFKSARTHQNRRADLFCRSAVLPPITTKSRGPQNQVRATMLHHPRCARDLPIPARLALVIERRTHGHTCIAGVYPPAIPLLLSSRSL
jgi:hypothetical protein